MKWSWRLGTIAGIGVYVHGTFLILLAWLGVMHFLRGDTTAEALQGLLFIVTLFGIVVLHELGHALTARRFGIKTRDITLLPIGGVARLERMPDDPRQELLVAIAGPAVNVVLAAVLAAVLISAASFDRLTELTLVGGTAWDFLAKLVWVNVVLAVFNMVPAFPMDGGRVLRAILAMRMDYVRATHIAATIGQGLAFLLGFIGLFTNPIMVFIALFVWMGASAESSMVEMRSALSGIPISRAMITEFHTLTPDDRLAQAVEHILSGFQQDFPVASNGTVVGVMTRSDLLSGLAKRGSDARVEEVMQREFQTADPQEMLESVVMRLQNCACHSLPIVRHGHLVGMINMENVGEFVMIQGALRETDIGQSVKTLPVAR